MICRNCLLRLSRQSSIPASASARHQARRAISSTTSQSSTPVSFNAVTSNGRPNDVPAATSTSAAQPFTAGTLSKPGKATKAARPASSVPAGTPLRGINYIKAEVDPLAKEDHEYPDWLWSVLDKDVANDDLAGEGDEFSKSKKQRRLAAKARRKLELSNPESLVPKIPLQQQTIDLFAGDGSLAGARKALDERQALTKALRADRRAKIKEANFLKAMG